MRQWIRATLTASVLMASMSSFATNVAVIDTGIAVAGSNAAKNTISQLNTQLAGQLSRMDTLNKELTALQARFEKDGRVMSEADRTSLQNQARGKLNELNSLSEGVQRRREEGQNNLSRQLTPKLEAAIEQLRKQGNYDIILERRSAIYVSPTIDLTKQLTDLLNK